LGGLQAFAAFFSQKAENGTILHVFGLKIDNQILQSIKKARNLIRA